VCLISSIVDDLPGYHQVSEHLIFRTLAMVGHLAWSTTWFLLSAMMVMISPELDYWLTQIAERVVTPAEALVFQAKRIFWKHKINTPL
jgi:isoleucyl-tRNA synthetase